MTKVTITGQDRGVRIRNAHPFKIFSVLELNMSNCTTKVALRGMFVTLFAIGVQVIFGGNSFASEPGLYQPGSDESRLATYDNAGETHFALSINPQSVSDQQRASDIVVFIDTSASQAGVYKRDSIEAVKQLLRNLNAEDRVQLVAVDLDPIPLTKGFVGPASDDISVAIENLNQRVSLGSTDLEAMLNSAAQSFPNDNVRNKNVIYIGDGVSRGNLLKTDLFGELAQKLADQQISVSSFAIGPDRNIELMAALANNTGGNLFVDTDDDDSVRQSSIGLAKTVHASVFWPTDGKLDDSVVDMFPRRFPPIRADRDTVVLGTLADRDVLELQIKGLVDGQPQEMTWSIMPEQSDEKFAFLPGMVRDARADNGMSLPALGSIGLKEYARSRMAESNQLSELGATALAMGDKSGADKLAAEALLLSSSPSSTQAAMLSMASTYKVQDPFGDPPAQDPTPEDPAPSDPVPNDPFGAAPAQDPPAEDPPAQDPAAEPTGEPAPIELTLPETQIEPGQGREPGEITLPMETETPDSNGGITLIGQDSELERLFRDSDPQSEKLIDDESTKIKIINQRIRQQVQFEMKQAREELRTNPDAAIERIKGTMDILDQTSDIYPDTRAELLHTLGAFLNSSRQQKLEFDSAQSLRDQNVAIGQALSVAAISRQRTEDEIATLINSFNYLLSEGQLDAAVDVTRRAVEISPDLPAVQAAHESAQLATHLQRMEVLREMKENNFLATMYEVERSTIPFSGEPAMIFPDADEWRRKKIRREKYQDIRISGSVHDEAILKALDEDAEFNYDEQSWSEVEEELEEKYGINIVLDSSASEDALAEDEPITESLSGIRFKNALRIMLKRHNATFVVKDEVLRIISLEVAEDAEWHVTNVYNVGDLVAPRVNRNQGAGGIGGGGNQGGGFGGGGNQGGGFGGGGNQGGGGGLFCIQETSVSVKLNSGNAPAKPIHRAKPIELADSTNPSEAWSEYFGNNFADPADVRLTVRKMMRNEKAADVVALIEAAIKHDQHQPWMYEGLVLAMQIAGQPQSDIERALMSAVDLSDDENDPLYLAQYMAQNKMESRAIRLLKSYSRTHPTRTEPFVVGLRAAQRIQDVEAIKWATIGIFNQEWPDHPEIVKQAKYASEAIKESLKKDGRLDELAAYTSDLDDAQERDCFIEVSWTGDADLDLFVQEPGGTICSRLTKRTTSGGVLMGDKFTPQAGASGRVSEQYILPKGFAGDYRLIIKRVWGEVTSGKVNVSISNHYRSDREASLSKQVELDDKGSMVLFSLDQGRRTDPLEDHEIETVVRRQLNFNRNALAQQLSETYSAGAASSYYGGMAGNGGIGNPIGGGLNGNLLRRGVVGYQPIIQTFNEGPSLNINHATTADRLYVMVSASPTFNLITSVSTFNILGDADTAQGVAGSGGGGNQGGGGGNQGGGGGGGVF